jgi:hypothetical protein
MTQPLSPQVLAWLRQCASVDGNTYSQVLLHLLERVEALEKREFRGTRFLAAPTPIAAALTRPAAPPAPAVVPVAVSERLPDSRPESEGGGGDCDAEGRCWVFMPPRTTPFPNWTLLWIGHMQPYHSHWLPASAIPLPQAGEGEA